MPGRNLRRLHCVQHIRHIEHIIRISESYGITDKAVTKRHCYSSNMMRDQPSRRNTSNRSIEPHLNHQSCVPHNINMKCSNLDYIFCKTRWVATSQTRCGQDGSASYTRFKVSWPWVIGDRSIQRCEHSYFRSIFACNSVTTIQKKQNPLLSAPTNDFILTCNTCHL